MSGDYIPELKVTILNVLLDGKLKDLTFTISKKEAAEVAMSILTSAISPTCESLTLVAKIPEGSGEKQEGAVTIQQWKL
jgi:hypothetical protein